MFNFIKRFAGLLSAIGFISFFSVGCIDIEYDIVLKKDGSQKSTIKVGLSGIMAGQAGDLAKSLEESGYKISIENEGEKTYVMGSQTFSNEKYTFPCPNVYIKDPVIFEPEVLDLIVVKVYKYNANFKLDKGLVDDMYSQYANNEYTKNIRVPMKYSITLPGEIYSTNADETNGNKMTWKYTIMGGQVIDIGSSSYVINYLALCMAILLIITSILISCFPKIRSIFIPSIIIGSIPCIYLLILVYISYISPGNDSKIETPIRSTNTVQLQNKNNNVVGVFDGTTVNEETGDPSGVIVTITYSDNVYTAKWDNYYDDAIENIPTTVIGNNILFYIDGTAWKFTANDTAIIGDDGIVYKRK